MPDDVITVYLSDLAANLPGPARRRAAVVAEIGDGLVDAVDEYTAGGMSRLAASRAAMTEFGDPAVVAAAFTPVLAAGQAHRYGIAFLVSGPAVGVLWLMVFLGAGASAVVAVLFLGVLAVAVPCAVFAVAATGRGSRWLTVPTHVAVTAVTVTAMGAVTGDLVLLTGLLTAGGPVVPAVLAGAASLVRLVFAVHTARRLLAVRATCHAAVGPR